MKTSEKIYLIQQPTLKYMFIVFDVPLKSKQSITTLNKLNHINRQEFLNDANVV